MSGAIGKDYDSRQLSREVRDLALERIRDILTGKEKVEKRFYQSMLLKLAGSALPRLNEVSGPDGSALDITFSKHEGNQEVS